MEDEKSEFDRNRYKYLREQKRFQIIVGYILGFILLLFIFPTPVLVVSVLWAFLFLIKIAVKWIWILFKFLKNRFSLNKFNISAKQKIILFYSWLKIRENMILVLFIIFVLCALKIALFGLGSVFED